MGLRIKTNVASLQAQRHLSNSTKDLQDSSNKLASGYRINKASDDAAGLSISENLRADLRSLNVAKRNAMDGVSLVQTAEGGLMETANMLVRLRELAIQGASDTIGNKERGFLDMEFVALKKEIDRIANSTEFNGTLLLTGNTEMPEELTGGGNEYPLEVQVGKDYHAVADAVEQENQVNIIKIDLRRINAFTSGEESLGLGAGGEGARVSTKVESQQSIATLDTAITKVNEYRAYLGSIQNRFISTLNNLNVQVENIAAARSRIRDTDFAAETARYTQTKILQQSGTSVLSQANLAPQVALSLIGNM